MTEKTQPSLTERKRLAILTAAATLFHRDGFDRTSMDRIAEEANVSKRTVYNHFASKDLLFQAIIDLLLEQASLPAELPYDASVSLEEQLQAICQDFIARITSNQFMQLSRVVLSRFLQSPELASYANKKQTEWSGSLVKWMKAAIADGQLQIDDPELAVEQLTGLIKNVAFWPQLVICQPALDKKQLKQVINSSVDMFLARYGV